MDDAANAEIGILGGTGLYELPGLDDVRSVEIDTPYGAPSSPIVLGKLGGRRIAFLARHGPGHRLLPMEIPYRANVWALKSLGVGKVFSPSAVGSLREEIPPRTFVVPDQIVDRTRHRDDTFFGDGLVAHVSMADPFSPALRRIAARAARKVGRRVREGGTYVCMEGPQFSTRAESRWYRAQGWHVIGMTCVTEARLCREAEIAYASIAMVTDYDAWREEEDGVSTADVLQVLSENAHAAVEILAAALPLVPLGDLPENRVLEAALVTPLDALDDAVRERLAPILARHLPA